ncbi:PREDICTED: ras-related GTP-binding protein D [Dipodomys ordii]|uniref:Ras-related GTP-binding protein n=1 Tax=Dipodomys ordii TaxID=10020 RepID=A0A1S3F643_DIPOR|nr:PREDICTED: ras-related GTP-binding protein D [Dipodomys ordii]
MDVCSPLPSALDFVGVARLTCRLCPKQQQAKAACGFLGPQSPPAGRSLLTLDLDSADGDRDQGTATCHGAARQTRESARAADWQERPGGGSGLVSEQQESWSNSMGGASCPVDEQQDPRQERPGGGSGPAAASAVLDFSDPFSSEVKPRILLMGLRRSGKSSIQKVVFHKMSPNETLFLESTNKICREDVSNSSFVNFQIWDFPGQIDFFDPTFDYEMIFRGTGALIFVIDSQDDYMEALARLHLTVTRAYKVNADINFEVFIHKVDGLSDDHKIETQRDIHQRANDDLADAGLEKIHLRNERGKAMGQTEFLFLFQNSGIEKAFLFDVVSKIYIATDSTPVDMQTYELCCDMIDVVIDISCIYGLKEDGAGTPYDKESTAIIKLNNTTVLYLKEVTKFLALVCFVREESFERKGLIDYNFHCFRKAIHEVFEVRMKVVKSRKVQNRLQKKKGATPNGTPRVLM